MDNSRVIEKLIEIGDKHDFNLSLNRDDVISFVNLVRSILFLGYFEECNNCNLHEYLDTRINKVRKQLSLFLEKQNNLNKDDICNKFISNLPKIKEVLNSDLHAFLNNDPAVIDAEEIILCYPGFYAISIYRISNVLINLGVEAIPRILSEHAHSKTGIDIHPRATIGNSFFIDHGTGVVIGETTTIGSNVNIYQGVTLGALSLNNIQDLKNVKRHPTISNNVTIYSGASILGGETIIGENTIIGSNVFITKSVNENSKVIFTNYDQLHKIKEI